MYLIQVHFGCVPRRFLHLEYGCVITLEATIASIGDGLPYLPYIALRVNVKFMNNTVKTYFFLRVKVGDTIL